MMDYPKMSLFDHLVELRKRLVYCLLAFVGAFALCYHYSDLILCALASPLTQAMGQNPRPFIYTGLSEAFLAHVKAAMLGGCTLACPVWFYHIWKFVAPALYPGERNHCATLLCLAPAFFLAGGAVAYFIVCPMAWKFFLSFENAPLIAMRLEARISEYIHLIVKLLLLFGLSFQLPVLLVIVNSLGLCPLSMLRKNRKYIFLAITVVAAVLTPSDIISPLGLILPVYALYEASLLWIRSIEKKRYMNNEPPV